MARWHRFTWVVLASWLVVSPVFAQEYFGKNKVNYSNYNWYYIDSDHFTIYFDKGSLDLAEFVAKEAERSLIHIEKTLKYTLKQRYPIIIYNSHNGFSVTNISDSEQSEFTGGFTEFAQGRVVIPFTGSYADLAHVIHHELTHAVTIELWTGGGWLGSLVSQTSTLPPTWVAEGIAEYVSRYGWAKEHDNFMRDATITGYVPTIEDMSQSYFAYPGGASVFYMISQDYGKDKVAEFISAFRTAKTPDKALKASLGFGMKELNEKYQLWLKRQYWNEINLHNTPDEVAKDLTEPEEGRPSTYNLGATFSPQGDKVVYLTDRNGTFDIYLMSAIDGKDLGRLVEGQKSSNFESMFVLRPGFTWSPDGREIAFAAKSNNKNTLYIMDVKKKKIRKSFKFDLDGLFEPTWSPDGKKIAIAGIKNGWSDVYVVDLKDDSLTRLTNDPYDERHLRWSPDGQWIAMSSDRPDTNLVFNGEKNFPFGQYDIFIMRPDGSEIRRVVADEAAEESHPVWGPDSKQLAFVSDRTGVGNIYITRIDTDEVYPITNLLSSAQDIDWSSDGKKMVFDAFHKGTMDIFVLKDPLKKRKKMADVPYTRFEKRLLGEDEKTFVEAQRAKYDKVRTSHPQLAQVDTSASDSSEAAAPSDSSEAPKPKVAQWISDQVELAQAESRPEQAEGDSAQAQAEAPSQADSDSVQTTQPSMGHPDEHDKTDKGLRKLGEKEFQVKKYKLKFKPELFGAQAGFDTFYGVSSFITLSMSDVMGDHRATLLTSLNFSLKDSDFLLDYAYLKHRNNYYAELFHQRFYFFNNNVLNADRYYGFAGKVEHPFSRFTRLEFETRFEGIDREQLGVTTGDIFTPGFRGIGQGFDGVLIDRQRSIIGEASLTGDTALYSLFGPVDGRRYRLDVEGSGVGMRFATFSLDYRKYIRMASDYTFAIRLSGGTSFGPNSTVFFVGGVNNPINPTFSTIASVDQNRVFFSSYIWPLRGVDLLAMAGNSYMLGNLAFRFPLIRQLAMGWPLPFFFQDVQGELFLDIGSAFNRGNFTAWEARDGGFELRDLKAGYGFGVRVNMGYFLFRYDLAWPTDFAQTSRPKQYFTIDFTGVF